MLALSKYPFLCRQTESYFLVFPVMIEILSPCQGLFPDTSLEASCRTE